MSDHLNTSSFAKKRAADYFLADGNEQAWPVDGVHDENWRDIAANTVRGYALQKGFLTVTYSAATVLTATCSTTPADPTTLVNFQHERRKSRRSPSSEVSLTDQTVLELEKLQDGWAGDGSVAPSKEIVRDVCVVLDQLPAGITRPAAEVDPDDGTVSLRWVSSDGLRSFSFTFVGNRRVTGAYATINPPHSEAWSADVNKDVQIIAKLEEKSAIELLSAA